MTTTTLNAAKPMAAQPTTSDKVWDVLLKITVAVAFVLAGMVLNHDSRLTRTEISTDQNTKDIEKVDAKIDAMNADVLRSLERIATGVEALGNRMTRIETKLEGR